LYIFLKLIKRAYSSETDMTSSNEENRAKKALKCQSSHCAQQRLTQV